VSLADASGLYGLVPILYSCSSQCRMMPAKYVPEALDGWPGEPFG
jgi:hypothetical protein